VPFSFQDVSYIHRKICRLFAWRLPRIKKKPIFNKPILFCLAIARVAASRNNLREVQGFRLHTSHMNESRQTIHPAKEPTRRNPPSTGCAYHIVFWPIGDGWFATTTTMPLAKALARDVSMSPPADPRSAQCNCSG